MHNEIRAAVELVMSYLYNKLPRRRVDMFGDELARHLLSKFSSQWYPDRPFKGSTFRCLKVNNDPAIVAAATTSGLDLTELLACLPVDLSIWVDPGEVSYQFQGSSVSVVYSEPLQFSQQNNATLLKPVDAAPNSGQPMTAAMFARTKFGSTKFKAERASRLSANELTAYVRQQAIRNARGPRYEWWTSPLPLTAAPS